MLDGIPSVPHRMPDNNLSGRGDFLTRDGPIVLVTASRLFTEATRFVKQHSEVDGGD